MIMRVMTIVAAISLSGCAEIDLAEFEDDLQPMNRQALNARTEACPSPLEVSALGKLQISTLQATPQQLAQEQATQTITGLYDSLKKTIATRAAEGFRTDIEADLSGPELEGFAKSFSRTMLNPELYTSPGAFYAQSTLEVMNEGDHVMTVADVFKHYYSAYIDGKFIDRFGTKISKPEVKGGVGNATIKAAVAVFIEALSDYALQTPLIYSGSGKNRKYVLADGKKPTAAELESLVPQVKVLPEEQSDECGITEREAKAIAYVANLAADKSELLSGIVLESFGDVEVAFVVGGNFSIGDNETLAEVTKTVFEGVSRRGTEELAFKAMWEFRYPQLPFGSEEEGRDRLPLEDLIRSFSGAQAGA